jgi:hypothetical protein
LGGGGTRQLATGDSSPKLSTAKTKASLSSVMCAATALLGPPIDLDVGVRPGASVIFTTEPEEKGPNVAEPEALVTKTSAVPSSLSSPTSS